MVQVDVFWTYALGAGFAVAAGRRLTREKSEEGIDALSSNVFRDTLLFLAILFAPSGVWLLWAFPSWETMHVGDRDLPVWLVGAFAITNITQGILGYWVAYKLIEKGKAYLGYLQWVAGYFLLWFILIHGWDGTGYQRFFSETKADLVGWTWATAREWATCDVALTLYGMGVFIIPAILILMVRWLKQDPGPKADKPMLALWMLAVMFVVCPGVALVASLLVHWLGWVLGLIVFVPVVYFGAIHRWGLFHLTYRQIIGETR